MFLDINSKNKTTKNIIV